MEQGMVETRRLMASACIAAWWASRSSGCGRAAERAELFRLDGKLFVFNYRVATASYLVNLVPVQPVDERPERGRLVRGSGRRRTIVVRHRRYGRSCRRPRSRAPPSSASSRTGPIAVSIAIEGADGTIRQKIDTTITSTLDQTILPTRRWWSAGLYEEPGSRGQPIRQAGRGKRRLLPREKLIGGRS